MNNKLKFLICSIFTFVAVHVSASDKITKADANDYIDCATFYTSNLSAMQVIGKADDKFNADSKERINFYFNTAKIYNGSKEVTSEMKERFLSSNKQYTALASSLLRKGWSEEYSIFVEKRINECKSMLNVNMNLLVKQQKLIK